MFVPVIGQPVFFDGGVLDVCFMPDNKEHLVGVPDFLAGNNSIP